MGEVLTNSQIGGRRNIIINGAMKMAQRGTSSTGLGATTGYYVVDRFNLDIVEMEQVDTLRHKKLLRIWVVLIML